MATNESLFLMKRYFDGRVDFRLDREVERVDQQQDDLLRRLDKHPNTRGALDLGLDSDLGGLAGMVERAESGTLRAVWIAFHPQLIESEPESVIDQLRRLVAAVEFSVVSSPVVSDWAAGATIRLPMAGWAEETGTYTNYAGRVQIARTVVAPLGEIRPLYRLMAMILEHAGRGAASTPEKIFDLLATEIPGYTGLDYDVIGPMGARTHAGEPAEVVG
jgi:predicted molibdopterin-dependent oxidoreductase YjgC